MAVDTARTAHTSFDLKSASLPVVAVVLKTTDAAVLGAELALRMADSPGFFDNDPVLIDVTGASGAFVPTTTRERVRASGPSVRGDLARGSLSVEAM